MYGSVTNIAQVMLRKYYIHGTKMRLMEISSLPLRLVAVTKDGIGTCGESTRLAALGIRGHRGEPRAGCAAKVITH